MLSDTDVLAVLRELKAHFGSNRRLALELGVTERTVGDWLKPESAVRVQSDHRAQILDKARDCNIQLDRFSKACRLWDWQKSYAENAAYCPELLDTGLLEPAVSTLFLGRVIDCPFGASPSVLTLNAARVRQLFHYGAGIVVYKTVRSKAVKSLPAPNIYSLSRVPTLSGFGGRTPLRVSVELPDTGDSRHGHVNRFGMPSTSPELWQADFQRATEFVLPGQVLILSIVGTTEPTNESERALIEDFVRVAQMGWEAGARILEINGSCPSSREGHLFEQPELMGKVSRAIRTAVPDAQLLIKIGYLVGSDLRSLVDHTRHFVNGYAAINTIPVLPFKDGQHDQEPAFGSKVIAGLSGPAIRDLGLRTVTELAKIRDGFSTRFTIVGVGGVSTPEHVQAYLTHGADAVEATDIFFSDPSFALKVRRYLGAEVRSMQRHLEAQRRLAVMNALTAAERLSSSLGRAAAHDLAVQALSRWQQDQLAVLEHGPRRALPTPTVDDFANQIEAIGRRAQRNQNES